MVETGWTVETLKEYEDSQIANLKGMLEERYQMQTKAVDSAFNAQQTAMKTAKDEQSVAMTTALAAQKDAVNAAMAASDKAGAKAETAADKRFEESNGYRQQLQNQAQTFATKDDVDVRMKAITDKLEYESQHYDDIGSARDKSIASLELRLTRRLDLSQGEDTGTTESRGNRRSDSSLLVSIGSLVLAVIAVATTIITVLSRSVK